MPDVVVVGGGLVGSATAFELTELGASVVVVDRGDPGSASAAGAGILAAATHLGRDDAEAAFYAAAYAHYQELIPTLAERGAGETGFAVVGILTVAGRDDDPGALDRHRAALDAQAQRHPTRLSPVEAVDPVEAARRFPVLREVRSALYHPDAARVDGRRLTMALRTAARARGADFIRGSVDAVLLAGERARGVSVGAASLEADAVVLAAGAWESLFARQLGHSPWIGPMRGQIVHLGWEGGSTRGWPIVDGLRGHYLLPWDDGRVVAGATREAEAGLVPELTAGGMVEVLGECLRLAPALAAATVREWRVGLRPVSADGRPLLGAVPGVGGCHLAGGHGPSGLLLGPYSARLLAGVVAGSDPDPALGPYTPARFATSPPPR